MGPKIRYSDDFKFIVYVYIESLSSDVDTMTVVTKIGRIIYQYLSLLYLKIKFDKYMYINEWLISINKWSAVKCIKFYI